MFFNLSHLKKLMKESWSGMNGLRVEVTEKGIIAIEGIYWSMEIDKAKFPNKAKAALIELIGEIPEAGGAYTFAKDMEPQISIAGTVYRNLMQQYADSADEYEVTNIAIRTNHTWAAIFQGETKLMVTNKFAAGIDNTKTEEDETKAKNPKRCGDTLIWCNNTMAAVCRIRPVQYAGEREFMESIGQTDLVWDWLEEERI